MRQMDDVKFRNTHKACMSCDDHTQTTHRTPDGYPVCTPCLLLGVALALVSDPTERPEDWGIYINTHAEDEPEDEDEEAEPCAVCGGAMIDGVCADEADHPGDDLDDNKINWLGCAWLVIAVLGTIAFAALTLYTMITGGS